VERARLRGCGQASEPSGTPFSNTKRSARHAARIFYASVTEEAMADAEARPKRPLDTSGDFDLHDVPPAKVAGGAAAVDDTAAAETEASAARRVSQRQKQARSLLSWRLPKALASRMLPLRR
jgi:hypothetical protein